MSGQAVRISKGVENKDPNGIVKPYISSGQNLPEITIKSFVLGILLALLMGSANAYLGLKIGLTVSATIPAAVISMAILRFFRNANILENNIVQTTASAGEVVAAGTMFTLPALVMMGYWNEFPMWMTSLIVGIGGVLGVLFSIPLRRALVVESGLKFPEGVATAEVLKVGDSSSAGGARDLMIGGIGAALLKFGQSGIVVFSESLGAWFRAGGTAWGFSTGLSPVLLGAGFIVGESVGWSMMIGGIFCFMFVLPIYGYLYGLPEGGSTYEVVMTLWSTKIRMMGVGMMVVGGLWTILSLIEPMRRSMRSSLMALSQSTGAIKIKLPRTEQDIPFSYVIIGTLLLAIPLAMITYQMLSSQAAAHTSLESLGIILLIVTGTLVVGFVGSSIAGYMSGIVGSSNNPLSGVTIMGVMSMALLMLVLLGGDIGKTITAAQMAAFAIIVGAVVACAGAVSCDNLQDLKSGQLVGATPWKQQVMLIVGVIAGSLIMAPVFNVLFQAYGIGEVFPREGMDKAQALGAPKAAMMAMLAQGVFERSLNWSIIGLGGLASAVVIAIDARLKAVNSEFRLPVLAVALGVYMPLDITVPVLIGGLISSLINKKLGSMRGQLGTQYNKVAESAQRRGLLFASGLVAGEALMGIFIAGMIVSAPAFCQLRNVLGFSEMTQGLLGALVFSALCVYLYKTYEVSKNKA